jgi:hypothetical protein
MMSVLRLHTLHNADIPAVDTPPKLPDVQIDILSGSLLT